MIVGILIVSLQQIVIHILGRELSPDALKPQSLEFQHGHGTRGILQ